MYAKALFTNQGMRDSPPFDESIKSSALVAFTWRDAFAQLHTKTAGNKELGLFSQFLVRVCWKRLYIVVIYVIDYKSIKLTRFQLG